MRPPRISAPPNKSSRIAVKSRFIPRREIANWVLDAWNSLDKKLIGRSFQSCALIVAFDGSQDNEIHCLKEGQPCHAALIGSVQSNKRSLLPRQLTRLMVLPTPMLKMQHQNAH